jgi:hypothetical protein
MGAGASLIDNVTAKSAHLKALPEALEEISYVDEKFAFVLDPTLQVNVCTVVIVRLSLVI